MKQDLARLWKLYCTVGRLLPGYFLTGTAVALPQLFHHAAQRLSGRKCRDAMRRGQPFRAWAGAAAVCAVSGAVPAL